MSTVVAAPPGHGQSGVGKAVLMIVGGGVLTQLLSTVTGVVGARMLGVEGRGQVVLVASLASMTSQLTLGGSLPNAITKLLAERGVTARDGLRHLVPRWFLWASLPSCVAGAFLLFVERNSEGNTKYALAVAVAVMSIQAMASRIMAGAMLGEGTALIHVAMTGVLPQAAVAIVLSVAYLMGTRWNAIELIAVTVGCVGVVLATRLRLLAKPTGLASAALDSPQVWGLARRTHIGSVGPIDGLAIDRTLVGALMGAMQLGLYSAAFALAGLTSVLGGALAKVVLPRVTIAQGDPVAERAVVRRSLMMSAAFIAVAVAIVEVTGKTIIRLAFGPDFVAAATSAHWLVAAAGLLDFRRVLVAVLQARNKGGQASIIELVLTPLLIFGIVLAATRGSLVGVGASMAAAGLVSCISLSIAVMRAGRRNRRDDDDADEIVVMPSSVDIVSSLSAESEVMLARSAVGRHRRR